MQLKSSASEKEGRAFLLHARMLGQLQHAGLLPLHDMGLHDECYFYAYRVPPGKSLIELIQQSNKGSGSLKPKSRHLIYLMSQIADALAYLHQNRVTIGRLTSESIYIGNFGEVIIKDFSKAQKFEESENDAFEKSRTEDLQSLAHLCMRIWLLSPEQEFSIREWDQTAHLVPLEFQEVLDKACLERGGRYANTQDFHKDLLNILQNRPPSFREGDLLFTLKGRYQKNKKTCITFLVVCCVFLVTLAYNNMPLGEIKKRIEAKNLEIKNRNQELAQKGEELKNEKEKHRHLNEINGNLAKKQKKVNDDHNVLINIENEVKGKIEEQKKLKLAKEEDDKKLKEKETLLRKKKQELEDLINNLQQQKSPLVKQENTQKSSFQEAGDFVCDHPDPRKALEQLNLILNDNSLDWFNAYLKKNKLADSFLASYTMAKREVPDNVLVHPNGDVVVWTADRQFFYFKISEETSLTSYLSLDQPKGLAFNGDRQFNSLNFGRLLRWTLTERGLEKSPISDGSFKETSFILHNAKSSDTWVGLGKANVLMGLDSLLSTSKIAKTEDLQRDSNDNIWALMDRKLILLPSGKIMLNCPTDMESWRIHPYGGLSVLHSGRLNIYKLSSGQEQSQILEKVWEIDLPPKAPDQNLLSVVLDDQQNRVWVSFSRDQNYLFDRTQREPKLLKGVAGRVLTTYKNTLVTRDDINLYCYSLARPNLSLEQGLAESQGSFTKNINYDGLKKFNINGLWEMAGSNYLIAIRDKTFVEIWNKKDQTRTARLAVCPTELSTVFYSPKYNSIIGGDAEGHAYTW